MDKDENRLSLIHKFATRYASELNADPKFEKTVDMRQAIEGGLRDKYCHGMWARVL
jgi:alpha-galactosidase/6-phospho-beta-glucosidase family protein